ncbi:hypothetical protein D3C87_1716430 [compost metagenome]
MFGASELEATWLSGTSTSVLFFKTISSKITLFARKLAGVRYRLAAFSFILRLMDGILSNRSHSEFAATPERTSSKAICGGEFLWALITRVS